MLADPNKIYLRLFIIRFQLSIYRATPLTDFHLLSEIRLFDKNYFPYFITPIRFQKEVRVAPFSNL